MVIVDELVFFFSIHEESDANVYTEIMGMWSHKTWSWQSWGMSQRLLAPKKRPRVDMSSSEGVFF